MAKPKPEITMDTWGIYRHWDAAEKSLPQIAEFTTRVPARVGIEFGFVVSIKKAKNQKLYYCIRHPGILDADGNLRAPFDGTVYIKTNDWQFYLGDTIWEPLTDKLGNWHLSLKLDGRVIAEKTFELFAETDGDQE